MSSRKARSADQVGMPSAVTQLSQAPQSATTAFHPEQTYERLPPHLAERLHSSDGETARNDRPGREAAALGREGDGGLQVRNTSELTRRRPVASAATEPQAAIA